MSLLSKLGKSIILPLAATAVLGSGILQPVNAANLSKTKNLTEKFDLSNQALFDSELESEKKIVDILKRVYKENILYSGDSDLKEIEYLVTCSDNGEVAGKYSDVLELENKTLYRPRTSMVGDYLNLFLLGSVLLEVDWITNNYSNVSFEVRDSRSMTRIDGVMVEVEPVNLPCKENLESWQMVYLNQFINNKRVIKGIVTEPKLFLNYFVEKYRFSPEKEDELRETFHKTGEISKTENLPLILNSKAKKLGNNMDRINDLLSLEDRIINLPEMFYVNGEESFEISTRNMVGIEGGENELPASYKILVTHPDYNFVEGIVEFTPERTEKLILMNRLGSNIEIEFGNKKGRIIDK